MSTNVNNYSLRNRGGDEAAVTPGMTGNPLVYESVKAPILKTKNRADVNQFLREREAYEKLIGEVNQQNEGATEMPARSLTTSFEPRLLRFLAQYELLKPVEDITDADLDAFLDGMRQRNLEDDYVDIKALAKRLVKMDLSNNDVVGRVAKFFQEMDDFLEDQGVTFERADLKEKVKLLVEGIRPEALRTTIQKDLEFQHQEEKKNPIRLYQLVVKRAKEQDRYHNMSAAYGTSAASTTGRAGVNVTARVSNGQAVTNASGNQKNGQQKRKAAVETTDASKKSRTDTSPPRGGCLHCKGDHWVSKCPTASNEKKKELLTSNKGKWGNDTK
jgi:hypothetical protein